jgi:hypothetical protein
VTQSFSTQQGTYTCRGKEAKRHRSGCGWLAPAAAGSLLCPSPPQILMAASGVALLLLLVLPAVGAADKKPGKGCEHKLDMWCPGWKHEARSACVACVDAHLPHLEPNCTRDKAEHKCGGGGGPTPSPPPAPPGPPQPAPPPTPLPPRPTPPRASQPNIVLMLTDDQDIELGSMNAMSFTSALGRQGANFTNFFAHTPVCCPSRSELLAGRYFHSLKNDGFDPAGCMHINASTGTPSGDAPAFAVALKAAGYATGLFGKHYNSGGMRKVCPAPVGDGTMVVPEGWMEYLGACPDTCYVNCTYNKNGGTASFLDPTAADGSNYGTSVIGNASLAFVKRAMAANWPFMVCKCTRANACCITSTCLCIRS